MTQLNATYYTEYPQFVQKNYGRNVQDTTQRFVYQIFTTLFKEHEDCIATCTTNFFKRSRGFLVVGSDMLYVPSQSALIKQAKKYETKYGIAIHVSAQLEPLLKDLAASITKPTYIGIILGRFSAANDNHYAVGGRDVHVVPLLCYFDGQQKECNECLMLSSIGCNNNSVSCTENKEFLFYSLAPVFDKEKVFYVTQPRQFDQQSCRTDAMILLRNALLYLQYYQTTNGFGSILELHADQIRTLPPEWTYTAQIFRQQTDLTKPVVRQFYSRKVAKRAAAAPETIAQNRNRHSALKTFKVTVEALESSKDYNKQELSALQTIPSDLKIDIPKGFLSFDYQRIVNTYLLTKSQKQAASPSVT